MKPKWTIYLAAGLTLIMLGVMACRQAASELSAAASAPAPTSAAGDATSAGAAESADWTLFCDLEIGCTLGYPPDVHFERGVNKFGVYTMRIQFNVPGAEGYQGMVIRIMPRPEGDNIDGLLEQIYASGAHAETLEEWKSQLSAITVNGMPAWRTYCSREGGDFAVIIPHADKVYVASPTHDPAATCSDPRTVELFFQVLDTLKLE